MNPRLCFSRWIRFAAATAALALLLPLNSVKAASATWNGTTNSTWSTTTNWSTSPVPGTGDTATFNNAGNSHTTLDLGTGVTIKTILFDTASAAAYTIGSGAVNSQALTLNNSGAVTMNSTVTANQLFNAAITLGESRIASSYTFTNDSTTNTLTFAGNITANNNSGGGSGGLKTLTVTGSGNGNISGAVADSSQATVAITKAGTGTWTLSGTGANTYSGATTINAGELDLSKTAGTNAIAGNVTIGDGTGIDILKLVNSNQIADASVLTFNGSGVNAGTFRMNAQSETVAGISSTGGAGVIENGTAGSSTLTVSNGAAQSFSGILQDGAAGTLALTKSGAGTLTLTGSNSYSGTTTISGGTLQIGSGGTAGALGSGSVTDNATLSFNRSDAITVSNTISGTGGLTQAGAGITTLSGNNSYSGATTVSGGTLILNGSNSSNGTTTVNSGTTLQLGAGTNGGLASGLLTLTGTLRSTDANSRTISNNVSFGGNATFGAASTGALVVNGTVDLNGATRTLTITSDTTFANAVSSSTNSATTGLTKAGAGTLTLSGSAANTYGGTTTVNVGELDLNKTAGVNAVAGNLTIGDGTGTDTVKLLAANQIADVSNVTLNAAGTPVFNLNGFSEAIDGLSSTNTAASVSLGAGTLTVGSNNQASATFAGVISGVGGLTKIGTGTQTLSGANTYTGGTNVNAGTLALGASNVLADTGAVNVGGGTFAIGGNSDTVAAVTMTSGSITGTGGTLTGSSYGVQSGSISAKLGGTGALTKTTPGTVILTGANSYSGGTNVNGGTLALNANNVLPTTGLVTLDGGTLQLNGTQQGTIAAAGAGALALTSSSVIDLASTSLIHFLASNLQNWTGTLSIWNYNGIGITGGGAEQILFGSDSTALTAAQLSQITFYSDAGVTQLGDHVEFAPSNDGEIVPVPEPGTWIAGGLVGLSLVAVHYRRRRLAKAKA